MKLRVATDAWPASMLAAPMRVSSGSRTAFLRAPSLSGTANASSISFLTPSGSPSRLAVMFLAEQRLMILMRKDSRPLSQSESSPVSKVICLIAGSDSTWRCTSAPEGSFCPMVQFPTSRTSSVSSADRSKLSSQASVVFSVAASISQNVKCQNGLDVVILNPYLAGCLLHRVQIIIQFLNAGKYLQGRQRV